MNKLSSHDKPEDSCKTIIHYLNKGPREQNSDHNISIFSSSLFKDYCFRLQHIQTDKTKLMLNSCKYLYLRYSGYDHKNSIEGTITTLKDLNMKTKLNPFDVGIITILGKEQRAVLKAFGLSEKEKPKKEPRKHPYWELTLPNSDGNDINVALTRVSKQRNVQCALAVQDMIQEYNPKIILLIGIAAGPEPKVNPMDVVFGTQVYDYEGGRMEQSGHKPRPTQLESYEKADSWFEDLTHPDTLIYVNKEIKKISPTCSEWASSILSDSIEIDLHKGTLVSGEKVLADASLENKRKDVDDRIRGGEMEAAGFVQAAKMYDKAYAIFRGISDYGDPDKPSDDLHHFPAALSAAITAKYFITEVWNYEVN